MATSQQTSNLNAIAAAQNAAAAAQGTIYVKPSEISQSGFISKGGPNVQVIGGYQTTTSGAGVYTGPTTSSLNVLSGYGGNLVMAPNQLSASTSASSSLGLFGGGNLVSSQAAQQQSILNTGSQSLAAQQAAPQSLLTAGTASAFVPAATTAATDYSNLTPQQQADLAKEKAIYNRLGLKQPTLNENLSFYGTRSNLTPDQSAYYNTSGAKTKGSVGIGISNDRYISPMGNVFSGKPQSLAVQQNALTPTTVNLPNQLSPAVQRNINAAYRGTSTNFIPPQPSTSTYPAGTGFNYYTNTLTMGNLTIYQVPSKNVTILGKTFPLKTKFDVMVNDSGVVRNATASEKAAYNSAKSGADTYKFNQALQNASYGNLIGSAPNLAVIKGARDIGGKWFGFTSTIIGTKNQMSQQQLQSGGNVIGDTLLLAGASPVMKTGSYGEAFELLSPKKAGKTTQQLLSSNKFEDLGAGLDSETKAAQVKSIADEIASKQTLQEQLAALKNIKSRLTTKEALDNFNKFTNKLIDDGVIKPVRVTFGADGKPIVNIPTKSQITYLIQQAPEMKYTGLVTGGTSNLNSIFVSAAPVVTTTTPSRITASPKSNQIVLASPLLSSLTNQSQSPFLPVPQAQAPRAREAQAQPQPSRLEAPQQEKMQQPVLSKESLINPAPLEQKRKSLLLFPFMLGAGSSAIKRTPSKPKESYLSIVKRFGREKVLGIYPSKEQAETRGLLDNLSTLSRTTRVRSAETGQQIPLSIRNPFLFRVGKRNRLDIVQISGLSQRSEQKEIATYYRKSNRLSLFKPSRAKTSIKKGSSFKPTKSNRFKKARL